MVIAITGANGYLGRNLTNYFVKSGHEVIKLLRQPQAPNERKFVLGQVPDMDILDGVDVLIHTAFDFSIKDYVKSMQVNANGTYLLFQAAKLRNIKNLVYISSISAFAGCVSNYGKVKLETEAILKELTNLGLYIIRPGLIWGENLGGVMHSLEKVAKLPVIPMVGANVIQYMVHYNDIARSIAYLVEQHILHPEPITLGFSRQYRFSDILKKLGARVIIPVPSLVVLYLLKLLEGLKLDLRTGSDNLISLMNQNENVKLDTELFNWEFREF